MVIVVINNKGGTGKTTTSVNLSASIANLGHRVLLVDLDSQASASLSLGVRWNDLYPSIADVLFQRTTLEDTIRPSAIPNLDLATGEMELANSDLILGAVPGRENRLSKCLETVRHAYDYILCDCPPSLSLLPINALVAADFYIVPITAEYLALEGLISLMNAVGKAKKGMDLNPELLGIVFTMVNPILRSKSTKEVLRIVRGHYREKVFDTIIRRNISLTDAPSRGKSIFGFAPNSRGARDYAGLADEVIKRCNSNSNLKQEEST